MGRRETYQDALMRACFIAGDETLLAKKLRVPVHQVVNYLLGDEPVPTGVFLGAVDIIVTASKTIVANNEELLAKIRARHRR